MVTRVLAAGQEEEEIRNSGILYLNEQDVKRKAFIKEGYKTKFNTLNSVKSIVKICYSNEYFFILPYLGLNMLTDLPSFPATVNIAAASSKGPKAEETGTIFF